MRTNASTAVDTEHHLLYGDTHNRAHVVYRKANPLCLGPWNKTIKLV